MAKPPTQALAVVFFVFGGCPGGWEGGGAPELGQGQAAVFCSLAKLPLTQRRGDTLGRGSKCGSIALTAMQTAFFRAVRTCSVGGRREVGGDGNRPAVTP